MPSMNGAVQFWEASDMWRGRSIGLVTLGAVILLGMSGLAYAQDGSEPAKTVKALTWFNLMRPKPRI